MNWWVDLIWGQQYHDVTIHLASTGEVFEARFAEGLVGGFSNIKEQVAPVGFSLGGSQASDLIVFISLSLVCGVGFLSICLLFLVGLIGPFNPLKASRSEGSPIRGSMFDFRDKPK